VYGLAFRPSRGGQELELFAVGGDGRVPFGQNDRLLIAFAALCNRGDEAADYSLVDDKAVPIFDARLAAGGEECRPCYTRPVCLPPGRLPRLVAGERGGVIVIGAVLHGQAISLGTAVAA
jgi:hypothetical protein